MMRNAKKLWESIDAERVRRAIAAAERASTGEVRVSIAPYFWGSVRASAERTFVRLGMTQTRQRNGVLFFLVPSRRRFVVLGDAGIHALVGQAFWDSVVAATSERFHAGDFTGGLVEAIERVAAKLSEHFPGTGAADVNELPDQIDFGRRAVAPPA